MSIRASETATGEFRITLTAPDCRKLHRIITVLGPSAPPEAIGRYEGFSDGKWWQLLVGQVAVMGGSRGWDSARKSPTFEQAIALDRCLAASDRARYIANVLSEHRATRFPRKAAAKLAAAVENQKVVRGGRVVLCERLTHATPRDEVRTSLVSHPSLFKLKSASDFMIGAGLSHDVIAFDARVVGLLREEFGLDATAGRVQGNQALYLALESALRVVCGEIGASLASLDRAIYRFRGTPEMLEVLK